VFTVRAALDTHQLATGHELDQPDHPLHRTAAKGHAMQISPRIDEFENSLHHFWKREINGIEFFFVQVKQSRLGQPWIAVSRLDTGALVRCSCPRDDCPFAA